MLASDSKQSWPMSITDGHRIEMKVNGMGGHAGDYGRPREAIGDHGRSQQATRGHTRPREGHGRPLKPRESMCGHGTAGEVTGEAKHSGGHRGLFPRADVSPASQIYSSNITARTPKATLVWGA